MMKIRLVTLFFALAANVGILSAIGTKIGDLYYNLDAQNKTAEVTCQYENSSNNYLGMTIADIPASLIYDEETYSVTSIGEQAFYKCSSLVSITIPGNVTIIGDEAFYNCANLISVEFNEGLKKIGRNAFCGCSSLQSIIIPRSVVNLGVYTFRKCDNMTFVTLNTITCSDGFYDSTNNVDIFGNQVKEYTIGDDVGNIPRYAFYGCSGAERIYMPNSVKSIGKHAFFHCRGLVSPVCNNTLFARFTASYSGTYAVPDGITAITDDAFAECRGLTSVTIPASVKKIGEEVFISCDRLTTIICKGSTPAVLENEGYNLFQGAPSSMRILVPCGFVETYRNAEGWQNYALQIQEIPAQAKSVPEDDKKGCTSYPKTGCENEISATANYGYHFTQWSDGNTDNPRTIDPTEDVTYTAEFAPNQYTITLECDAEQGKVEGAGIFDYLTEVKISATPNEGYHFVKWSDNDESATRTVKVEKDLLLTAQFESNLNALDDINSANTTFRKELINGQLFILRGDKTYTVQGQEVK